MHHRVSAIALAAGLAVGFMATFTAPSESQVVYYLATESNDAYRQYVGGAGSWMSGPSAQVLIGSCETYAESAWVYGSVHAGTQIYWFNLLLLAHPGDGCSTYEIQMEVLSHFTHSWTLNLVSYPSDTAHLELELVTFADARGATAYEMRYYVNGTLAWVQPSDASFDKAGFMLEIVDGLDYATWHPETWVRMDVELDGNEFPTLTGSYGFAANGQNGGMCQAGGFDVFLAWSEYSHAWACAPL